MSISTKNALRALEKQLYAYNYAQALMSCDEATAAPPCSEAGRAEAAEVLSRAAFALLGERRHCRPAAPSRRRDQP